MHINVFLGSFSREHFTLKNQICIHVLFILEAHYIQLFPFRDLILKYDSQCKSCIADCVDVKLPFTKLEIMNINENIRVIGIINIHDFFHFTR